VYLAAVVDDNLAYFSGLDGANTCQLVSRHPTDRQIMVIAASVSMNQLCGTACHLICSLQTSHWKRSRRN